MEDDLKQIMEDDLKKCITKMEDNLKKYGRQPKKRQC
jgi:hypothetical protein